MMSKFSTIVMLLMTMTWQSVNGHGRLVEPPSRSSMWRYGFDTPHNYDDNNLSCGGIGTQWYVNGGKCGVCGDPWNQPSPRDNEAGGRYGNGIITRHYTPGQTVEVRIEVTINHRGWFQFRLCPHDSPTTPITQQCLDQHLLELADGSGTRYTLSPAADSFVGVPVKLPRNLTCSHCVLQWKWHGGDLSGDNQMEYYGCSDVAIETAQNPAILTSPPKTHLADSDSTTAAPMPAPSNQNTGPCHGINVWFGQPELDDYCNKHCPQGDCPPNFCACPGLATGQPPSTAPPVTISGGQNTGLCRGINAWQGKPELDIACNDLCSQFNCPLQYCFCSSPTTTQPTTVATTAPPVPTTGPCRGINAWQGKPELDLACNDLCLQGQGNCPFQYCSCFGLNPSQPATTASTTPSVSTSGQCHAINAWQGIPDMDLYCQEQCPRGNCPPYYCACSGSTANQPSTAPTTVYAVATSNAPNTGPCRAVNNWNGVAGLDRYCDELCAQGNCPPDFCSCSGSTVGQPTTTPTTTTTTTPTTAAPTPPPLTTPVSQNTGPCHGVNAWQGDPQLDRACNDLCSRGNCPPVYCSCSVSTAGQPTTAPPTVVPTTFPVPVSSAHNTGLCHGINAWQGHPELDRYCQDVCPQAGKCPLDYCSCSGFATAPPTVASTAPMLSTCGGHNTGGCYGINAWQGVPELDLYCQQQCPKGNCPSSYCSCSGSNPVQPTTAPPTVPATAPPVPTSGSRCYGINAWQGVPELDLYCQEQCVKGNCPAAYCSCSGTLIG